MDFRKNRSVEEAHAEFCSEMVRIVETYGPLFGRPELRAEIV